MHRYNYISIINCYRITFLWSSVSLGVWDFPMFLSPLINNITHDILRISLTRSDLYIAAEHLADGVARHASVRGAMNVLPIGRGRERQKHQGAVSEHSPHTRHIVHRVSVRGRPVDIGRRTSGGRTVQPGAAGIWEFDPRRRFQHEAGPA